MAEDSSDDNSDRKCYSDDEDFIAIDNYQSSPTSSPPIDSMIESSSVRCTNYVGISDQTLVHFREMGFSYDMIARAVQETGTSADPAQIYDTLFKYSTNCEASSSRSKMINDLTVMGFSEELVIKTIRDYEKDDDLNEDNLDEITNALLSYTEAEKLRETGADGNNDDDDEDIYSGLLSSDEEDENKLLALMQMGYSREESSMAIERCGQNASIAECLDFIAAAQMSRQFDEFFTVPDEEEERIRRTQTCEPSRRRTNNFMIPELIHLPKPMIGFGVPNEPGIMMQRPIPIPEVALGPPYFYYENVAKAPTGVWAKISSHLYGIKPEFVDSKYLCATMRKRGYIHNLPIKNRFQIQPLPPYTIQEAFPDLRRDWPHWDKRTKFNCLLTSVASAQLTKDIRDKLERHNGDPPLNEQKWIMERCKRWNLVWLGRNSVAPLEPAEMEKLLSFPKNHTRGGGITKTDRYKSLGNSFQVDTVAYHLSVLKPLFPDGIRVLSLFTGIGGGEVALHRLQIPMNVVVSVEISEANRNVLSSFWEQTKQKGTLIEFSDVQKLDDEKIEKLMDIFGGFDLVIGGSPCNNLAGSNRVTRNGLEGAQSSLFYDYCRILKTVRNKAARMRR